MSGKRYRGILTKDDRDVLTSVMDGTEHTIDSQTEIRMRRRAQQGLVDLCLLNELYTDDNKVVSDGFKEERTLPFAGDSYNVDTIQTALSFLIGGLWDSDQHQATQILEQAIRDNLETPETVVQTDITVTRDNRDELLTRTYERYQAGEELDNQESHILLQEYSQYGCEPQTEHKPTQRAVLLREELLHYPSHFTSLIADDMMKEDLEIDSNLEEFESVGDFFKTNLEDNLPDLVTQITNNLTLTVHAFKGELSEEDYEEVCSEIENASADIVQIMTPDVASVREEMFQTEDFETDVKRIHAYGFNLRPPTGNTKMFELDNEPRRVYP
ncbi:hypothetical protein SAMN05444422_10618 [Halobiforma haloterrestris]|uniref:Domain of unknown function domain-containing protein n=1 Tax=Natronobacterium haloterrestre TaxID=148448 RepID=A0A1I1HJR4_NATHA|nr:hypothetical protein [Halobiforma haloterrestris]SFC24071.1 hypothetical protein SAMN05444422_10618 [Halobiforma haloterrestris]